MELIEMIHTHCVEFIAMAVECKYKMFALCACEFVSLYNVGYTCWPHNPQWMQIDLSAALIWKAQRHIILIKWNDIEIIKSFIHFNLKFSPFLSLSLGMCVCVHVLLSVCVRPSYYSSSHLIFLTRAHKMWQQLPKSDLFLYEHNRRERESLHEYKIYI